MTKALEKFKKRDWNNCNQDKQADGSVIVTLTSRKWEGTERFRVRDLLTPDEQLLDIDTGEPIKEA